MGTGKTRKKTVKKAPKGTVSVQTLTFTRRLKYRYNKKEFFLTLPPLSAFPEEVTKQLCKIIELDISLYRHDDSQQRYTDLFKTLIFLQEEAPISVPNPVIYRDGTPIAPVSVVPNAPTPLYTIGTSLPITSTPAPVPAHPILEDFRLFLEITGRSQEKDHYHNTYIMVKNWGDGLTFEMLPGKLTAMQYASSTFNSRKSVLSAFGDWLVRKRMLDYNAFLDTPSRRKTSGKRAERKRLLDNELRLVLHAIRTDQFVHPYSFRYKHSQYYPIILFMALTGVRPAEAIGLRVSKVNFRRNRVTIDETLARTRKGTHSKIRIRKGTKMEDSRELPFHGNIELKELLRQQCEGRKKDDLVFPSPEGLACDDRKMNEHVLAPVLAALEFEHRTLYFLRHSFISRCFELGLDIKSVQALTGHRDLNVLINIYAEVTASKVKVPCIANMLPGPTAS